MNNLKKFTPLFITVALWSCTQPETEDQKFERFANHYVEYLLNNQPELATYLGDHRYDDRLNDYTLAGIEAGVVTDQAYLDSLLRIDKSRLSQTNAVDYEILQLNLEATSFYVDTLRAFRWNPLYYNVGGAVYSLIAREFAPLKDRLMSLEQRLKAIPDVIAAAKANLTNPPRPHTETAIRQNQGTISMVRDELNEFLDRAPELKDEFAPVQAKAVQQLEDYQKWLEEDLLPRSNGDFRIGETLFRRKLYFALESDLSIEEIATRAREALAATQSDLYATALPLYRSYFPALTDEKKLADKKLVIRAVLDKLAENHAVNETIVDQAKADLKECTDFVASHNLVTVPDDPIRVIVMPEFQRGVAVAYCDAAGPLEKNGETFFSISPTPESWSKERVESFFREYNDDMVKDLTIHEGMPGHYLQLALANQFKAPTSIRAIFSSGTFVEGWATYAEQLMAEQGFGGPELKMEQGKMRLRLIINALIDQGIHTANMSEQQAMDLMMNEGFQEEGEAAGKWRRAQLSSTQLSTYFVGNIEINAIRDAYEASTDTLDLKTMHDKMLSYGSPAAKYVMRLMGL